MVGVRHRLDLFGVLVLSYAAANAGGIIRDVLIGATPPAAIEDWRYAAVSLAAGLFAFHWYPTADRLRRPVLVLDGAGLALFAVSGALKALAYRLPPVAAILLGGLTGVGGGVTRDILVNKIPTVLRKDLYALSALAGAAVVVVGLAWQVPENPVIAAGVALCFGLRLTAIRRGWNLPTAFWAVE